MQFPRHNNGIADRMSHNTQWSWVCGNMDKMLCGPFKGTFETKNCFEIIPITVMAYTKDHGLLGIDVLKVDTSKLVNSMESEEEEIGLLKGYKASFCLKENYDPRYIQARWLPIHILPIVVSKLEKMIQQGILEKVTHEGSNWASPVVTIKKTDGDIRICGDYKIGINHQICSDSFPLPSIETSSHKLANMKHEDRFKIGQQPDQNRRQI